MVKDVVEELLPCRYTIWMYMFQSEMRHWSRLRREAAGIASLVLKDRLDEALDTWPSNGWQPCPWQGIGTS